MQPEPRTFPTLRRWQQMSESEQDALLDRIETRRRWGGLGPFGMAAILGIAAAVIGMVLLLA
jgi:hypothetical protein